MDLIQYFGTKVDQVFDSKTFEEARDHYAFFLGAYHLAQTMNLLSSQQDKVIKDMHSSIFDFILSNWENDK